MKTQLVIGMPAGSLADSNRGGSLIELLEQSGFTTSGYDKGGPSRFETVNFLYGWDGRPQEFGSQIELGELDVAIAGDDWIQERIYELDLEYGTTVSLEKALSLQRGNVRIVGIAPGDCEGRTIGEVLENLLGKQSLITVVSEMPYMALQWLRGRLREIGREDAAETFSVQNYKTPPRIEQGILIYKTWGKTEAKLLNGGADLGVEITQTGSAIRNYGLSIIDEIMVSETGIWINPALKNDPAKSDLLEMFLLNLFGAINAEDKVLLLFNVSNQDADNVEAYLSRNNLFGNEPTVNRGHDFTQYTIQVEAGSKEQPIAQVRYELAKNGAKNIDTIPLLSSIPGLDSIRETQR